MHIDTSDRRFCYNTTATDWQVLKLAVLTFLGAFYSPGMSLGPYTFIGPLWWQGERFFTPLQD
jgi:hypothetical protein